MEHTTFDPRNDMISISELKQMVDDAQKQGVREVEITKQVFIPKDEELNDDCVITFSGNVPKPDIWQLKDLNKGE